MFVWLCVPRDVCLTIYTKVRNPTLLYVCIRRGKEQKGFLEYQRITLTHTHTHTHITRMTSIFPAWITPRYDGHPGQDLDLLSGQQDIQHRLSIDNSRFLLSCCTQKIVTRCVWEPELSSLWQHQVPLTLACWEYVLSWFCPRSPRNLVTCDKIYSSLPFQAGRVLSISLSGDIYVQHGKDGHGSSGLTI